MSSSSKSSKTATDPKAKLVSSTAELRAPEISNTRKLYLDLAEEIGEQTDREVSDDDSDYKAPAQLSDEDSDDDFNPAASSEDEKPKKRKRKITIKTSPAKAQPSPPRPVKRARSNSSAMPTRIKDRILATAQSRVEEEYQLLSAAFGVTGDNSKGVVKKRGK